MTDILNPPDENKLASERKIPSIGSEGATPQGSPLPSVGGIEAPEGIPMPIESNPEQAEPMGQPIPMPATAEQGQAPDEEYGQNVFVPEMNPQNIRYSPIETPLPSFNGIDALQEATSTPALVQGMVENQQATLSPDNIREVMGMVRPQPIEWSGKFESDSQEVRDRLIQLQYQNRKYVEQNDLGLQNAQFETTGERTYGVSAVDNGVAARGMLSGIGKDLQDTHDPSRENNTVNRILGWLDKAARGTGDVLYKTFSWVGAGLALDPAANITGNKKSQARNAEIQERIEKEIGGNWGTGNIAPTEAQSGKFQMNPVKGQWGDYGDHPIMSPILYLTNVPQAVVNGLIYDAADLIHGDTGKSDKQRSRTLQALEGRDYGASNRWSENKYLSLQEPEEFTSGKLAANDERYKNNPMAKYWDFPEWFEKTPVGKVLPGNEKTNHLLFQTLPSMAAEVITGGIADWGVSSAVSTARNARIIGRTTKVAAKETSEEVGGAIVKIQSQSIVPFYETTPVTTRIRTRPVTQIEPTGGIISQKLLPSGERLSSRINTPKPLTDGSLFLTQRSNADLSILARNTINPVTGKPITKTSRVLSDIEIAKLQEHFGNLFDRYGEAIPDIEGAKYIERSDGSISEIIPNEVTIDVPSISSPASTAKILQEVDDLGGELRYALEIGKGDLDSITERIMKADDRATRAIANTPEEQLYEAYINKLPDTLVTDNVAGRQVGNELVKHQQMLAVQRPVLDQLTEEVDNLKVRVNETLSELQTLPDFKRGNIEDNLNTKALFEPEAVPEIRVEPYVPKLIPEFDSIPTNPVFEATLATEGKRSKRGTEAVLDKYAPPPPSILKKEERLWLHGSSSPVGIRERDILNGATPSEFGLGTYLTTSQDVADQAAYAIRQNNRPPRPDSVDGSPYRTTVDVSKLNKVVDLNAPPDAELQNIFAEARKGYGISPVDNTSKKAGDMWNQFDVDYANKFGSKAPESVKREFQQKVLLGLQKAEIDGGVFRSDKGDILVNYMPHKLGVVGANTPLETPSITKQLEARKWLDQQTFETLPNDVTRSYHLQSKLAFESKVLQDTSEVLVKEQFKQGEVIEQLAKLEDELEGITYRQKEELLRIEPETPKLDMQKTLRESSKPCL